MKKTITFVTHGSQYEGADPSMTAAGILLMRPLSCLLPANPSVICGTGRRHLDTYEALKLRDQPTLWTPLVGGAETFTERNLQKTVLLACNMTIPKSQYATKEVKDPLLSVLNNAPDGCVVCSGRRYLAVLGKADALSGSVYRISFKGKPILDNLDIQEVILP